jgi:hypothetical protein
MMLAAVAPDIVRPGARHALTGSPHHQACEIASGPLEPKLLVSLAGTSSMALNLPTPTLLALSVRDVGFYAVAITTTGVIAVLDRSPDLICSQESHQSMVPTVAHYPSVRRRQHGPLRTGSRGVPHHSEVLITFVYGSDITESVGPARVLLDSL